ncbi:sugar ABC transporter ATPase [Streptomyces sp. PVA_94-07]|nr:sugar ABC transporter ATPase [Streptomyces sp. PVA_94-07]
MPAASARGQDGGLVGKGCEVAFGVESGRSTGPGGGDGLAVDVVDDVAGGKDSGEVRTGGGGLHHDVALVVQVELSGEEFGAGVVADGDEQSRGRPLTDLACQRVAQGHSAEHAVLLLDLDDLAVEREGDLVVGEGAVPHDLGGPQGGAAVDDGDGAGEAGEESGLLHGGVAAADHDDVAVAEEEAVTGGAPGDATSGQLLLVREAQLAVAGSGRDDHGLGAVDSALGVCEFLDFSGEVDGDDVVVDHLRAELLGLGSHVLHEDRTVDTVREAGEVLDLGRRGQRAAHEDRAAEQQRLQLGAGGVEGSGVSGGAGSDDDDLADLAHAVCSGFAGAISSIRFSTSFLISSRIGRTASTPWPAGSSSVQSR